MITPHHQPEKNADDYITDAANDIITRIKDFEKDIQIEILDRAKRIIVESIESEVRHYKHQAEQLDSLLNKIRKS